MAGSNPQTNINVKVNVEGAKNAKAEISGVSNEVQKAGRNASSAIPGFDALGKSVGVLKVQVQALKSAMGLIGTITAIVGAGVGLYKWISRSREEMRELAAESAKVTDEFNKLDKSGERVKLFSDAIHNSKKSLTELSDLVEKYKNHKITMEEFAASLGITQEQLAKIALPEDTRSPLVKWAGTQSENTAEQKKAEKENSTALRMAVETIRKSKSQEDREGAIDALYQQFGSTRNLHDAARKYKEWYAGADIVPHDMMVSLNKEFKKRDELSKIAPVVAQIPSEVDESIVSKLEEFIDKGVKDVFDSFEKMMRRPDALNRDDLMLAREIYQRYNAGEGIQGAVAGSSINNGSLLGNRLSSANSEVEMAEILMRMFPDLKQLDNKEEARLDRNRALADARRRGEHDINENTARRIDGITVTAPQAASSIAAIGGSMGERANRAEDLMAERVDRIEAINKEMLRELAKISEGVNGEGE